VGEVEHKMEALSVQRAQGWDVGGVDRPLPTNGTVDYDAYGSLRWRVEEDDLFARLQPARRELLPYYVPTLFQSVLGEGSERLLEQMRPLHTVEMDEDFARGVALRELFEQASWPKDTAVVIDAPGPRSIAVAAALADRFDPVFTFGNWPHPLGVVPAHLTLEAALFYLPMFERTRAGRAADAPPLFVLDSNRLSPYRDADTQFDNRYLVKLPSAAQLLALGMRHVLYVDEFGGRESDDLNQRLSELCEAGIEVKVVALADFQRGPAPVLAEAEGETENENEAAPPQSEEEEPQPTFTIDWFWWGGFPEFQVGFWESYGWYSPSRLIWVGPPHGRRGIVVGPPPAKRPTMSGAERVGIAPRPTLFHSPNPSRPPPIGFGQVDVRTSRVDGTVTAVRPGGYQSQAFSMGAHGSSRAGWPASLGGGSHSHSFSGGSFSGARSGSFGRVGGGGFSA
jgi:hypothetical protein